jgi:MFS family permease
MSTARLVSFGPSATLVAAAVISTKLPTDDSAWYHIDFGTTKPSVLAQSFLVSIVLLVAVIKLLQRQIANNNHNNVPGTKKETSIIVKPKSVRTLQIKFLTVFWLMRFAFWMAGPYFYAAFASKKIHGGQPMPVTTISHISLTGYAAIAVLGPWAGKISQAYGKRIASIVGMVCYGLGSLSIASNSLPILFLGRICSGVGQSILSNAPESWFIAEIKQKDRDPNENFLGETFGLAYSLDSMVAIAAGQLAQWAAASRGPTGPFTYSPWFLVLGAIGVLFSWTENAPMTASQEETNTRSSTSIQDTLRIIMGDPKIICLGIVQSLFEAAMYIFVITWAPLMQQTIQATVENSEATPYGKIFSCFMAACMLGSTFFTILNKMIRLERIMIILLATASLALTSSLVTISNNSTPDALFRLFFSFLAFEACVGIYFPTIGTIRASILPDSHRSAIMTLFAVPLNALVVTCFLLLDKRGHKGGVMVAAGAVGVATMAMIWLDLQSRLDRQQLAIGRFQKATQKIKLINMVCTEFAARLGANGQVYMVNGRFSRRESRSSFASLNAPMT